MTPMDNPTMWLALVLVLQGAVVLFFDDKLSLWIKAPSYTFGMIGIGIIIMDFAVHMDRYFTTW